MNHITQSLILIWPIINLVLAAPEIIGGTDVENPDDYKFISNIFKDTDQHCTGTRIAENFILTAGHCTVDNLSQLRIVFANSKTQNTSNLPQNTNEIIYVVNEQFVHPGFNKENPDTDDIALFKISPQDPSKTVPFNSNSVRLDDGTYSQAGSEDLAMGYGLIGTNNQKAVQLQKADLVVANFKECSRRWLNKATVLQDTQLCAGSRLKNPCSGDSGGPLFHQLGPNEVALVGTVSFGTKCGTEELPTVYTKVASYRDYINNIVNSNPPANVVNLFALSSSSSQTTTTTTITTSATTTTNINTTTYPPTKSSTTTTIQTSITTTASTTKATSTTTPVQTSQPITTITSTSSSSYPSSTTSIKTSISSTYPSSSTGSQSTNVSSSVPSGSSAVPSSSSSVNTTSVSSTGSNHSTSPTSSASGAPTTSPSSYVVSITTSNTKSTTIPVPTDPPAKCRIVS